MKMSNFSSTWNKLNVTIEFDASWRNGTGYYDHAVHGIDLEPGTVVRARDVEPNNRRLIIIGTRFGNVVIFERYTPKIDDESQESIPVVINCPAILRNTYMVKDGVQSDDDFALLVGTWSPNIGERVERLFKEEAIVTAKKTLDQLIKRMPASHKVNGTIVVEDAYQVHANDAKYQAVSHGVIENGSRKFVFVENKDKTVCFTNSHRGAVKMYVWKDGCFEIENESCTDKDIADTYNDVYQPTLKFVG